MTGHIRVGICWITVLVLSLVVVNPVMAGAHTWRVVELFSNADGTIQFVEIKECCGGTSEQFIGGHQITSAATGNSFTIPANLTGSTSLKRVLFATPAFAAQQGAPTPNYIFPAADVPFFSPAGDTVSYVPYDSFIFGAGALPTDGVHSLNRLNPPSQTATVACNSPTNYAGGTGSINLGCSTLGDVNGDTTLDGDDVAAFVRAKLGTPDPTDLPLCAEYCTGTLDGDIAAFVSDLL